MSSADCPQTNPAWSGWMSLGNTKASRLAKIFEKVLASQLAKVIGRQLRSCVWSRLGFGRRVSVVVNHERGGSSPRRMPLKRARRPGERMGKYVRYHSYGSPSGPGDLRSGSRPTTDASSSAVIGAER